MAVLILNVLILCTISRVFAVAGYHSLLSITAFCYILVLPLAFTVWPHSLAQHSIITPMHSPTLSAITQLVLSDVPTMAGGDGAAPAEGRQLLLQVASHSSHYMRLAKLEVHAVAVRQRPFRRAFTQSTPVGY